MSNFYLLYIENSLNFTQNINTSTSIYNIYRLNELYSFVFYCLKSLDKRPFSITYEQNLINNANKVLGYIIKLY